MFMSSMEGQERGSLRSGLRSIDARLWPGNYNFVFASSLIYILCVLYTHILILPILSHEAKSRSQSS